MVMPDREKVIKAYEDFVNGYECFCTSDDYEYEMHKAVLALLKEHLPNGKCVNECECWDSAYERGKQDALKEQEAVEQKTGHWIYKKYDDMFMCSSCRKYSIRNDYPYCHWCGAKMEQKDGDGE